MYPMFVEGTRPYVSSDTSFAFAFNSMIGVPIAGEELPILRFFLSRKTAPAAEGIVEAECDGPDDTQL